MVPLTKLKNECQEKQVFVFRVFLYFFFAFREKGWEENKFVLNILRLIYLQGIRDIFKAFKSRFKSNNRGPGIVVHSHSHSYSEAETGDCSSSLTQAKVSENYLKNKPGMVHICGSSYSGGRSRRLLVGG
jgi:hypothetical protein